jgi:hypothetical protein
MGGEGGDELQITTGKYKISNPIFWFKIWIEIQ